MSKDAVNRAWHKVRMTERHGARSTLPTGTSFGRSWTARRSGHAWIAKPPISRFWRPSGCGRKVLLFIRDMGDIAAWRRFLDDPDARGLKRLELVIVDGAPGLEAALPALLCARINELTQSTGIPIHAETAT